jgi:hypothetical protein
VALAAVYRDPEQGRAFGILEAGRGVVEVVPSMVILWSRRFDWMLITDELEFIHYATLSDVVSDHRAVVASIG